MKPGPGTRRLLLAVAACGICLPRVAHAQISPGPLSRPHASLDGTTDCLRCHTPRRGVDPDKCLGCHGLLRSRTEQGKGLHASPGYAECGRCHPDHYGRDFDLIWWGDEGTEAFDHGATGFSLSGRHASVECRDCHRSEFDVDPGILLAAGKDPTRSFLGLSPGCDGCHFDEHRGQFGAERTCDTCHGTDAWRPATRFNHADTGFPLRGSHAAVQCVRCHAEQQGPPARDRLGRPQEPSYLRLAGISGDRCTNCHFDEHRGQFPTGACARCHDIERWIPTRGFDHTAGRYSLTGRHLRVACADCHRTERGRVSPTGDRTFLRFRPLDFSDCDACHSDPHEGRLGGDCAGCHTTGGWRAGAVARAFDHDRTAYPLRGAHVRLACESCHPAGQPLRVDSFDRCDDCHADAHRGQLQANAGEDCATCHDVASFRPARFGVEEHALARFVLEGKHRQVPCERCHLERPLRELVREGLARQPPAGASPTTVQLHFGDTTCAACHADPHTGQLDVRFRAEGCESCHGTNGWAEIDFDHAVTGYRLQGRHAGLSCRSCHPPLVSAGPAEATPRAGAQRPASANLRFKDTPEVCQACHEDEHRGQFAAADGLAACGDCHDASVWKPARFDHQRDARFPLDGAHAEAACSACHPTEMADGEPFVRYKPRPLACRGCHGTRAGSRMPWP